ncbi:MAG TPA: Rieske 2Fe-2S domain-containing protein [Steroidobacteraceae bacterium]|nr:Rieske 2Fe-2S domain-containing protein [Steroidobacteraceae bacterium]
MLSKEDNDTLTRVGPGTPMGTLLRRFWIPALLASEVAQPDGKPVRVRLLGEDLVGFRDSEGRVGLLDEHCPHRRASLALGLNAHSGLRCLYHGWKFGVDGRCQDAPTEAAGEKFCARIRTTAYATHEAGGVIWAYMGPPEHKPVFPDYEWLSMPGTHAVPFKIQEDCNYAQAVEGTIDSAHAGVLHKSVPWDAAPRLPHEKDLVPKLEVEYTRYGLRYGAVRKFDDQRAHVRVTQVVLPFYTFIPPDGGGPRKDRRLVNCFVPRDDTSTWHVQWFFDETQPIDVKHRIDEGGHWVDENFRKLRNRDNWYMQDREAMLTSEFAGIRGVVTQDHAVSETQGPILDRTKEHLGTSDVAVVAWRRLLIKAARTLAETGQVPPALDPTVPWRTVRADTRVYPASRTWKEELPLDARLAVSHASSA